MGKIFIDLSKTIASGHASGLNRYNIRLSQELKKQLGEDCVPVRWSRWTRTLRDIDTGHAIEPTAADIYIIGEAFDPNKRWGWCSALETWPGKTYAVFHDNIPGTHPELCFPHVVKRHSDCLNALSQFDGILAVSSHSAEAIKKALGEACPSTSVIGAGADFQEFPMWNVEARQKRLSTQSCSVEALMVGIIEPRKNQTAALEAQRLLQDKNIELRLRFIGRKNDHFGDTIVNQMMSQKAEGYPIDYVGAASDEDLNAAFEATDVLLFPSLAEGFGLPPFESLARGVPCITCDLPGVSEHLQDAPIIIISEPSAQGLEQGILRFIQDKTFRDTFVSKAQSVQFPSWSAVAERVSRLIGTESQ